MTTLTRPTAAAMTWRIASKDWRFIRWPMLGYLLLGILGVGLLTSERGAIFSSGMTVLLSVIILIGAHLIFVTVLPERTKQTLPLLLSLPITYRQYCAAKLLFCIGTYVVPWTVLCLGTLAVIAGRETLANGLIPYAVIILGYLFLSFVLVLAVAIVSHSEPWTIVTTTVLNISVSIVMFATGSIPGIGENLSGPVAVWNEAAIGLVALEAVLIVALIAAVLAIERRRTDFL